MTSPRRCRPRRQLGRDPATRYVIGQLAQRRVGAGPQIGDRVMGLRRQRLRAGDERSGGAALAARGIADRPCELPDSDELRDRGVGHAGFVAHVEGQLGELVEHVADRLVPGLKDADVALLEPTGGFFEFVAARNQRVPAVARSDQQLFGIDAGRRLHGGDAAVVGVLGLLLDVLDVLDEVVRRLEDGLQVGPLLADIVGCREHRLVGVGQRQRRHIPALVLRSHAVTSCHPSAVHNAAASTTNTVARMVRIRHICSRTVLFQFRSSSRPAPSPGSNWQGGFKQ